MTILVQQHVHMRKMSTHFVLNQACNRSPVLLQLLLLSRAMMVDYMQLASKHTQLDVTRVKT